MSDTPKSFRELAREMREAAKVMKQFARVEALAVSGCAEDVERLADEWERNIEENASYLRAPYVIHKVLGAKERR